MPAVRIQINIYGEDGIDSVVHSLHIDPSKKWERVLCWSIGARATFSFGGKAWDVWDGALLGWDYASQGSRHHRRGRIVNCSHVLKKKVIKNLLLF